MAITTAAMELLCYYKENFHIKFSNVAMLGRQAFLPSRSSLNNSKFEFTKQEIDKILSADGYSEGFFEVVGAEAICSFDYSPYEGATHLYDFNLPIGNEFKNKYSLVYDGGTMEHIFNYPIALRNAMEICEIGGCIVIDTPTNNWCGHGLYQFSPDLFVGMFCAENGFELISISYYKSNFLLTKKVINLTNASEQIAPIPKTTNKPTTLSIVARKIAEVPAILTMQQSSYKHVWAWKDEGAHSENPLSILKEKHPVLNKIREKLPARINKTLTNYVAKKILSQKRKTIKF